MPVDHLARAMFARQLNLLASTQSGNGAARVGTTSGLALQDVLDRGVGIPISGVEPGGDAAAAIEAANVSASAIGGDVILPPYTVILSRPVKVNRLRGTPGLSKIDVSNITLGTWPLSQYCIINEHWSMAYSATTADRCSYRGFEILTVPTKAHSLISLANVVFAEFYQVTFRANRAINSDTGKPFPIDALLDFYACVHGARVRRCQFYQSSGAYGSTRVAAGGGGCIWVRNISGNGNLAAAPENYTEGVVIEDNDFQHYTSDEAIAIYGVRGTTRRCKIVKNRITSLEAADLGLSNSETIYRASLVSVFPLDDGSGANLGSTAAVYENEISDNEIIDKSTLYSTIRIGNSVDVARRCENNRSRRNRVQFKFWSDANYGHVATWTAAGATGTNPAVANIPVRCIEGTPGTAYSGVFSGNVSEDDEIATYTGSTTITGAFTGWQLVKNGRTRGAIAIGALACTNIEGGLWETSLIGFSNCIKVSNPYVRINAASSAAHAVFVVDTATVGSFLLTGARVSGGALVYVSSTVNAGSVVNVQGCSGSLGAYDALTCNKAGAVVKANGNYLTGCSAANAGAGTFKKLSNSWNGTDD